jgi:hypothetical protein
MEATSTSTPVIFASENTDEEKGEEKEGQEEAVRDRDGQGEGDGSSTTIPACPSAPPGIKVL